MGRTSGWTVLGAWLVTRAAVLWLLAGHESWVTGDVDYFANSLAASRAAGLGGTLPEYPLPGVGLIALPWLLGQLVLPADRFDECFAAFALAADAGFTVLLLRLARTRAGVWVWLLAVPALGATTYARFDLVPGILAGVALLLLASRPRLAGAAAAAATGLKLWPALLVPALAAPRGARGPVLRAAGATLLLLLAASAAVAGWDRLVSPLSWQQGRGLQIESVPATPAMIAWAVDPDSRAVWYAASNSYEVAGPGVAWALAGSTALTLVAAGLTLALWARAWRRADALTVDEVSWTALAAVTAAVVVSKVLSPQYLLWLLPIAAAALCACESPAERRRLRRWCGLLLVAAAATHVVFPLFYLGLVAHQTWSGWIVLVLAARNALLVWLAAVAVVRAWGRPLETADPAPRIGSTLSP